MAKDKLRIIYEDMKEEKPKQLDESLESLCEKREEFIQQIIKLNEQIAEQEICKLIESYAATDDLAFEFSDFGIKIKPNSNPTIGEIQKYIKAKIKESGVKGLIEKLKKLLPKMTPEEVKTLEANVSLMSNDIDPNDPWASGHREGRGGVK